MRTAEEIAVGCGGSVGLTSGPASEHGHRLLTMHGCFHCFADAIRAARIEAVEEFRRRALEAVRAIYDDDCDAGLNGKIAALPALPEGA